MDPYVLASIVITLATLLGYLNHRYIKMQSTIAIMAGALILSIILLILQHTGFANILDPVRSLIEQTDFRHLLLNGMLSFLLFAGALTIDTTALKTNRWEIGVLASASTIISALLIAAILYYLLPLLSLPLPFLYCLLFGALISPTDPIAVLATFKDIGAPKDLSACVAGESLFNDGVGIVLFLTFFQLTFNHVPISIHSVSLLFLQQAVGGLAYGAILGLIARWLIHSVDDHKMVILITLAVVTGGYTLALYLDISGALAMVVAGLFVGHKLNKIKNQQLTLIVDSFWEIIDEVLNAVLFMLIGFELLTLHRVMHVWLITLCVIPLVLLVRLVTVAIPISLIQLKRRRPYTISILTWGGLRGGLAVALALSLPVSQYRDIVLAMTFAVVSFAIIVQGMSIKVLTQKARQY